MLRPHISAVLRSGFLSQTIRPHTASPQSDISIATLSATSHVPSIGEALAFRPDEMIPEKLTNKKKTSAIGGVHRVSPIQDNSHAENEAAASCSLSKNLSSERIPSVCSTPLTPPVVPQIVSWP